MHLLFATASTGKLLVHLCQFRDSLADATVVETTLLHILIVLDDALISLLEVEVALPHLLSLDSTSGHFWLSSLLTKALLIV